MEENNELNSKEEIGGRVYELAFHIVPTMPEENVAGKFGDLKSLVETAGGVALSEEMPRLIPLMYEMSHVITNKKTWFDNAYFGWIKFECDPEKVGKIDETLKRDEQILRYMVIKTVRENTIASKKPFNREYRKKTVEKVDGEAPVEAPMTTEEIDQEIDALVDEKV